MTTTIRLRHLAQINPGTPSFDRLADGDEVTFLPMEAVWPGSRLDISQRRVKKAVSTGYTRFQNGDILVPKITPTFEAGRAVLIQGLLGGVGAGTTELHVVRPGRDIDPRFLLYIVNTHRFLKLGQAEMYGVAGQQRVPDSFLRDLPVLLPSLSEQRRIADFLDTETARIDGLLDARERHIALAKERWEATIYQELIQSRAPEVELRRLGVKVTTGPFGTVFNASQYQEGGVPMVNPLHIRNGSITPDLHHAVPPETAARLARHRLRAGDLVVGRKGDLGRAALVQESQDGWVCGSDSIAVQPGSKVRPHFLDYVLRSQYIRSQLLAKSLATTMPSLNEGNLLSLRIPHLTLEQQDAMAERLDRAHGWLVRATNTMRKQLELLRERRQALITAAVTGQFDVSTASGRNVTEGVSA